MTLRRYIPPMSIVLVVGVTLAGAYFLRKHILEMHMAAAITLDDPAAVENLLDSWPCPLNARNWKHEAPLHWAAYQRRPDIARKLLAKGAEVDPKADHGFTPLHYATIFPPLSREMVELLIDHGADVNARSENGAKPLFGTVTNRSKDVMCLLIARGAEVNTTVVTARTPLAHAAIMGWNEGIETLLASGASLEAKCCEGQTPLSLAICARKETVALLISRGANVNARSDRGWTPLHWAAWCGLKTMADTAMENTDDPRLRELLEWRRHFPFDVAPKRLREEYLDSARAIVEMLIARGAGLSAKNDDGQTPLMMAVKENHEDVAEILRKAGAKE